MVFVASGIFTGDFARQTAEEKDAISHRGEATRLLAEKLKEYFDKQK